MTDTETALNPILQEVISAALRYAVREMRTTLIRSSYSPILYEIHDLSCCLTTTTGQIAAMYVDVPLHIFPVAFSVPHLNTQFADQIRPGDIYMTNDPWTAGAHLNDVEFLKPIFVDGELELIACARAHHGDVGGMTPGSVSGSSTEILHEGLRFPILPIVREGVRQENIVQLWLANVRQPFETEGVIAAQIGACDVAEARVREVFGRFGRDAVRECVAHGLEQDRNTLGRAIAALPDGEFFYEDYIENSGSSEANRHPIYTRASMKIAGDRIAFDFSDSTPQRAGVGNCELADTWTGAFTVAKTMLDPGTVATTGGSAQLDITTKPGTVVDAQHPSPVAGFADTYTGLIQGSAVALLSQVMPDGVCPPTSSTANQMFIGGPENPDRNGEPWFLFEWSVGGWCAVKEHDGAFGCPQWYHGDIPMFWPVERVEMLNPLRLIASDLLPDSGGPGHRRGGVGIFRAYEILAPGSFLSFVGSNGILPRPGMGAGYGGRLNSILVLRGDEVIVPGGVPLKVARFDLELGDVVVAVAGGGGGYGDPLQRQVEAVLGDIRDGCVSPEGAQEDYGVIIEDGIVDEAATRDERARLEMDRAWLTVTATKQDEYDADGLRILRLAPATAARLGVEDGSLLEFALANAVGVRAWAKLDPALAEDTAPIGPFGRRIIRAERGEQIWVRTPWTYGSTESATAALVQEIKDLMMPLAPAAAPALAAVGKTER
jgi:N-methylhydantoinase B